MKCHVVETGNGGHAIVCTSGRRRQRCVTCKEPANLLCDWKVGDGRTCDAPICADHTYKPANGKDLCPRHATEWKNRQEKAA